MNLQEQFESGLTQHRAGRLGEAERIYRQILTREPNHAEALHMLGVLAGQAGRMDAAADLIRRAIEKCSDNAFYYSDLGNALRSKGELEEAIAAYRRAIELNPEVAEVHNNLGNALMARGQLGEAIAACQQAIGLKPDFAEAHYNLGTIYQREGRLEEAVAACRQAIRFKADFAMAYNNLGMGLLGIGRLDEAIASFRQAMRLKPNLAMAHSNLVYALQFDPSNDGRMIHEELRRWNQRHAEPLKKFIQPHVNSRDPDRRLRIGYVSPDFRQHVVGQNLLPLLREHDREQVEIFCYSNVIRPDRMTEELRRHAGGWRSIVGMPDARGAEIIREDGIDILVDLALHTEGNRLGVFGYKPAPVQATYLGYCGSTGMDAVDYRLSDPYLDPPETDLSVYRERTIRLPETFWCYRVGGPTPEPSPPPATATGCVTFGCLSNFVKDSPPALDLWAEILLGVPSSRLIVHSRPGKHLDAVRERFAGKGISPDRLEFSSWQPWRQYVESYGRIDIVLDPFPWGGGITTCDALWMGVPVVTLAGQTAVGRGGVSILSNIGLPELIAPTRQEYVQIATGLANDLPRLAELRRTLRPRMQGSPLMDGPRFARNVEAAYRQMWRNWCAEGQ